MDEQTALQAQPQTTNRIQQKKPISNASRKRLPTCTEPGLSRVRRSERGVRRVNRKQEALQAQEREKENETSHAAKEESLSILENVTAQDRTLPSGASAELSASRKF